MAGCLLAPLAAPSHSGALGLEPVGGPFSSPVFVTSPPGDPRLFVVEQGGQIRVVKNGTTLGTPFLTVPNVAVGGERGLLSMAFDPNYGSNGLFYVFYTGTAAAGGATGDIHIDEYRVGANPDLAATSTRRPVMTLARGTPATNHNGGQLQFGKDGLLYIAVGDAATGANAQSLASPHGKILRIDPHGSLPGAHGVPASNPFANVAGAVREIWSLGLRNPWRFSFDRLTGDLVIGDVGAAGFEEVDYAPASAGLGFGTNFGWPNCEGFSGTCPGTTPPVFAYLHSAGGAIIGGYVYRGSQIPELAGRYVYADLDDGELRSLRLGRPFASDDRSEGAPSLGFPLSFGEDASCGLYVTNANSVQRIVGSRSQIAPRCVPIKKKCKKKKRKKNQRAAEAKKKKKKHKKKRCKKKKRKKGKR